MENVIKMMLIFLWYYFFKIINSRGCNFLLECLFCICEILNLVISIVINKSEKKESWKKLSKYKLIVWKKLKLKIEL